MTDFRDLAYLIEKQTPARYAALKAAHPDAGRLFATTRTLGGPQGMIETYDARAVRDFCQAGLAALRTGSDALVKKLAGKLHGARRLRLTGSLVAMASSAGLAAATLEFIPLDQRTANLTLSGLAFAGAALAAFSDDAARGPGSGADPATLLAKLAVLSGEVERTELRLNSAAATGAGALDVLQDLNSCAARLAEIRTLARAGG